MTTITIEGIKVYAYHGHLKEEAILGGHFNVNVWIEVNTDIVEESDELTAMKNLETKILQEINIRGIENIAGVAIDNYKSEDMLRKLAFANNWADNFYSWT